MSQPVLRRTCESVAAKREGPAAPSSQTRHKTGLPAGQRSVAVHRTPPAGLLAVYGLRSCGSDDGQWRWPRKLCWQTTQQSVFTQLRTFLSFSWHFKYTHRKMSKTKTTYNLTQETRKHTTEELNN